jgi:hypothetical protein
MKTTASLIALLAFSFSTITLLASNTDSDDGLVSVLKASLDQSKILYQDAAIPPVPQEPSAPIPADAVESPSVILENALAAPAPMAAINDCCQPRFKKRNCKPKPVPTLLSLKDPCGCEYEACVKVPVCCIGETPTITWKSGLLDRQVANLCWPSCGFEAKVIVNGRGKVRVRD